MKIAYLILAHRYPEQLLRLVERLDSGSATFLIHLDRKMTGQMRERIWSDLGLRMNVHFIERFTCVWGGFGIVQASCQGIKEVVERGIDFDYLALLSGQDYPIKRNREIAAYLESLDGRSVIGCNRFPYEAWRGEDGGWDRVNTWNIVRQDRIFTLPNRRLFKGRRALRVFWRLLLAALPSRKFPAGFHPCGGAQFWCLHREHVLYVYHFVRNNPGFCDFFRYVHVPDEIMFQTIIGNAPFIDKESDTLTFLEWERPGAVLSRSDSYSIRNTYHLFARKFDTTIDTKILDLIDREMLGIKEDGLSVEP